MTMHETGIFEAQVQERQRGPNGVSIVRLGRIDGRPISFVPGQYVTLHVPGSAEPVRCYSIAQPPDGSGSVVLCMAAPSDGQELLVGDTVNVSGPEGTLRLPSRVEATPLLLVAMGTAITPFLSMVDELRAMAARGRPITVLHGLSRASDSLFATSWSGAADAGLRYWVTTTRDDSGARHGRVQEHLAAALGTRADETDVFVVGADEMVRDVVDRLKELGVPERQIHTEG